MKRMFIFSVILAVGYLCIPAANAQETFTGTVYQYGSGRYTGLRTSGFTLRINSMTSDARAKSDLATLQSGGQDALLKSIRNEDLGRFALTGDIGRTINAVREVNSGGKRKIYVVFERWEQFAELRGGYRSLDYPFGYVELTIDPRTGKGTGQYFAAAKIRWKKAGSQVEIEDYATFPAKLVEVRSERRKP